MTLAKPKPTTLVAFLPSKGFGTARPRATLHKYVTTREVSISKDSHGKIDGYEHIYVCTETGAERRWGTANLGIMTGGN